jgi:hypothetical protein
VKFFNREKSPNVPCENISYREIEVDDEGNWTVPPEFGEVPIEVLEE